MFIREGLIVPILRRFGKLNFTILQQLRQYSGSFYSGASCQSINCHSINCHVLNSGNFWHLVFTIFDKGFGKCWRNSGIHKNCSSISRNKCLYSRTTYRSISFRPENRYDWTLPVYSDCWRERKCSQRWWWRALRDLNPAQTK